MKIKKNVFTTILILLFNLYTFGQESIDGSCNQFVENINLESYQGSLEKYFIALHKIDTSYYSIIIFSEGQTRNVLQINLVDSFVFFNEYQYINNSFKLLNNSQVKMTSFIEKATLSGNYYQFFTCNNLTDQYSKQLNIYAHGILKSKIAYEGIRFSNSRLSLPSHLQDLFLVLNLYEER